MGCLDFCQKRLNFLTALPEKIRFEDILSVKLFTVVICRSCPNRLFCLPLYACKVGLIQKYMSIWRNINIYNLMLDELENKPVIIHMVERRKLK